VADIENSGEAKPTIYDSTGVVRVGETIAGPLELSLASARVTQCRSDYAFSLVLEEDAPARHWIVRIEGPFSLVGSDYRTETFGADGPPSAWGAAIDVLLHATLIAATVAPGGTLTLSFENGQQVEVRAHEQWEAWQVEGPDELRLVCGPGGELSRWAAQGTTESG
jgi:Family of unknown function (DUF6188)